MPNTFKYNIQEHENKKNETLYDLYFMCKLPTVANKNFCAASRQRNSLNRLMSTYAHHTEEDKTNIISLL